MLARFECPRCQTVFTHEKGDDEAFFECPSCGALAMSIGEARAAAMVAAATSGLPVFEYTPSAIKESVCGYGGNR